ncbi:MAG: beta-galactosidase [Sedimentisphaerales bacterium]|nr:beta-galactosidase [Sedimentisphaerales bacterium]MBN2843858.1 beta-galactosidase [Sedimentisphaerales bacterium]
MNKCQTVYISSFIVVIILCFQLSGQGQSSPYGVCAHISRSSDHGLAMAECQLVRQGNMAWVRTDFDWTTVEPSQSQWDFSYIDETLAQAQTQGVNILPILCYDVPWARPAYKHMDQWLEYVERTVSRYKDSLGYWEIWNEQNLAGFWHDMPNPEDYAGLLVQTYKLIKKIDPDLQVVIGGLAGVPLDYIEGVYQAGAKDYFDIMAVHPYRYPGTPERTGLAAEIARLKALMAKYDDDAKSVWITEVGWPTHISRSTLLPGIIRSGLLVARPGQQSWKLAIVNEPDFPVATQLSPEQLTEILPDFDLKVEQLDFADFQTITAHNYDAVIMPASEALAVELFESLEKYIAGGGIAIFSQGLPMYYAAQRLPDGNWHNNPADSNWHGRLHFSWEAFWTRTGVPEECSELIIVPHCAESIRLSGHDPIASRFLTSARLQQGDKFIPLIQARKDDYTGTIAGVYLFDSKLKGALIVSAFMEFHNGVSLEQQALMLPRACMLARNAGVDRILWYNLRANENDPYYNEDNFGIVHKDLSPKPAYIAFKNLASLDIADSVYSAENVCQGDIYRMAWQRPDQKKVFAFWTTGKSRKVKLSGDSMVESVVDNTGSVILYDDRPGLFELKVSISPFYVIGTGNVELVVD